MSDEKDRTLYLHGRPSAHVVHQGLARSITNDFSYVDEPLQWQQNRSNFISIFFCWIYNAFYLRNKKEYSYFLVDNLHITPVLYKALFPLRSRKQKFIVHLGSHTLYFMYIKKFSTINLWIHKWALSKYDALLCDGKMENELAQSILGKKCPPSFVTFIGPLTIRSMELQKVKPELDNYNILIIASGPSEFRMFYKGIDLMLKAFNKLYAHNNSFKLTLMGDWNLDMIKSYLDPKVEIGTSVILVKNVSDLGKYCQMIEEASLCLQVTRGDAFPTSTLEAMVAGLPCLVSEFTGTKQIIEIVDENFICKLEEEDIVKKTLWYFSLSDKVRKEYSSKFRNAVAPYSQINAEKFYRETFDKIKVQLKA